MIPETYSALIEKLISRGVLKTPAIIEAFRNVDRAKFVPEEEQGLAYEDTALPIGYGATISQPYTVAFMLELLAPARGDHVLDVGSGSGWTTALLAHIVGSSGQVLGVEIVPELVGLGRQNLAKFSFSNAEIRQSGKTIGAPKEAPFDKILVSAAGKSISAELINQLASPGRMVIPVETAINRVSKDARETVRTEIYEGFVFVPLQH